MELDTLKVTWAEQDRKLDASLRLNRRLLLAANMSQVQSPLRRFAFLVCAGAGAGLIALIMLGQFVYHHWSEPRFALPALLLHVWTIAGVAASVRLMATALRIDYGQPVAAIQKQLESLRALRIRVTQWALLTGQLVWWIPFLIVALKGIWGVDAYQVLDTTFLLVNLAAGLALIPLAISVSRKFAGRLGRSPVLQWLTGVLAGYNLNAATAFLATFEEASEPRR